MLPTLGRRRMTSLLLSPTPGPTTQANGSKWPGILPGGEEGVANCGAQRQAEKGAEAPGKSQRTPRRTR